MKKLSIILLALVIAAPLMAVPAIAGDISADGSYMLRGRADSNSEDNSYFQHELDLNINVQSGDVQFHWDIELADTDIFDGTGLTFDNRFAGGDAPKGIWDGFYVKWAATDAMAFKAGIYGVSDNNSLMFDSAGNGDGIMGITYALDMVDFGAYLSKQEDNPEDDITEMLFTTSAEIGPAGVSLVYGSRVDDVNDDSNSQALYLDGGIAVGPVGINVAYGSESGDLAGDGGNIILANFDLSDLVGFSLGLDMINTNKKWVEGEAFGNDYGYAELLDGDAVEDTMIFGITAGYTVNDQLSLSALAIVSNDAGDNGDGPTEVDVALEYDFADNVTYQAGYASVSGGDPGTEIEDDVTRLWHRIDFDF